MRIRSRLLTVMFLPVFTAMLFSCSSDDNKKEDPIGEAITENIVGVSLGDLTTRINIGSVSKDGSGFVVVVDNAANELGVTPVNGDFTNLIVDLSRRLVEGESVTVSLHNDASPNDSFDANVDLQVSGVEASVNFQALALAGIPDIRLNVKNAVGPSWSINSDQLAYSSWGSFSGGNNPTISINVTDLRVEINNSSYLSHPFSLLTLGESSASDIILISQATNVTETIDGTTVGVFKDKNILRFNYTSTFSALFTGYRCEEHKPNMRGAVQ